RALRSVSTFGHNEWTSFLGCEGVVAAGPSSAAPLFLLIRTAISLMTASRRSISAAIRWIRSLAYSTVDLSRGMPCSRHTPMVRRSDGWTGLESVTGVSWFVREQERESKPRNSEDRQDDVAVHQQHPASGNRNTCGVTFFDLSSKTATGSARSPSSKVRLRSEERRAGSEGGSQTA